MLSTLAEDLMGLAAKVPFGRRAFLGRATVTLGWLALMPAFPRSGLARQSCPDLDSCTAGYNPCSWQICNYPQIFPPQEIGYCDYCFEACEPTICYYSQTYVVGFYHSSSCFCVFGVGNDPNHTCDDSC